MPHALLVNLTSSKEPLTPSIRASPSSDLTDGQNQLDPLLLPTFLGLPSLQCWNISCTGSHFYSFGIISPLPPRLAPPCHLPSSHTGPLTRPLEHLCFCTCCFFCLKCSCSPELAYSYASFRTCSFLATRYSQSLCFQNPLCLCFMLCHHHLFTGVPSLLD